MIMIDKALLLCYNDEAKAHNETVEHRITKNTPGSESGVFFLSETTFSKKSCIS